MVEFQQKLPYVHGSRGDAVVQILALDQFGQRRDHYAHLHDPSIRLRYGLYVRRRGGEWDLEGVYSDLSEARSQGTKIRRQLRRGRA